MSDGGSTTIGAGNAAFTYPGTPSPILTNVSFEVPKHSLLVILGPNGVGKTVLLCIIIGLQKWDSGHTLIDGTPISSMSIRTLDRVLSYAPQARNTSNTALTGLEMVMVGRVPRMCTLAQPGTHGEHMTHGVLDEAGASHLAEMPRATMSDSQLQMILIVRVLVADPHVLVLDESETGLDSYNQLIALGLLEHPMRDRGPVIIMNMHHPTYTLRVADQVAPFSFIHEVVMDPASSVMSMDTLASIFGADTAIGSVAFEGEDIQAVVPIRSSEDKQHRHVENYFVTTVRVGRIFIASAVPYNHDSACLVRGYRCRVGVTGSCRLRRRGRTVPQRWGEHEGGSMATGIIKRLNDAKGFGLIIPDNESDDVFMHYLDIIGQPGHHTFPGGKKVEHKTIEGPKDLQAMNVTRARRLCVPGWSPHPGTLAQSGMPSTDPHVRLLRR